MISEETHIGLEISFDNTGYQQKIARYEEFIERLSPSVARLRKLGIALEPGMLWHFEIGRTAKFLWDLSKNNGEKELSGSANVAAIDAYEALLDKICQIVREYPDCTDVPIVKGFPVLTEEFKCLLRIPYSNRIRTTGGERFYRLFLEANKAVRALIIAGAEVGDHFTLQADGLKLNRIAE